MVGWRKNSHKFYIYISHVPDKSQRFGLGSGHILQMQSTVLNFISIHLGGLILWRVEFWAFP